MFQCGHPPFAGFDLSRFTAVPNQLFDELLNELEGAEVKVLLYVMRRTVGFHKPCDGISLQQMMHGIVGRDGQVLDRGCGIKRKKTLLDALRSLIQRKIICHFRRRTPERGDQPTVYSLNVIASASPSRSSSSVSSTTVKPECNTSKEAGGAVVSEPDQGGGFKTGPHMIKHDKREPDNNMHAARPVVVASSMTLKTEQPLDAPNVATTALNVEQTEAANMLRGYQVAGPVADALARKHPPVFIQQQVEALPFRNPVDAAAMLVKALRGSWPLPQRYLDKKHKAADQAMAASRRDEQSASEEAAAQTRRQEASTYLSALSAEERASLDAEVDARLKQLLGARGVPPPMRAGMLQTVVGERLYAAHM